MMTTKAEMVKGKPMKGEICSVVRNQHAGDSGDGEAEAEAGELDPVDIDADDQRRLAALDQRLDRQAEDMQAQQEIEGEADDERDAQGQQPVAGHGDIAEVIDVVEIEIAAGRGGEGKGGEVLQDDRDAEEDEQRIGFEAPQQGRGRQHAPEQADIGGPSQQRAGQGRKADAEDRGEAEQGEAPEGDIGAEHDEIAMRHIEQAHGAVDEIEPEAEQGVERARREGGEQQLA